MILNKDCMEVMKTMGDKSVHTTLTDIPYGEVSRPNNGLRQMRLSDRGAADIVTFDVIDFCKEVDRVTSDNIIIFCGKGQFSTIFNYFAAKAQGTVRCLVWRKTNPVPSNGQYVYLSGVELAVWFRKPKGTFNAHCKNTVFDYAVQTKQIHPTEKNHKLLEELILDNSNEDDLIFDPCMGSGATGLAAYKNNRKFLGVELNTEYFEAAKARFNANGLELDNGD